MTPKGRFILLAAAFLTLAGVCQGQPASNWRVYKMADGLPESACVSVTVSPQGKVLAKHLNLPSISELDGYRVNVLPSPDLGPNRVYTSPAGQLWAVTTEGLRELKDNQWLLHPVPEIAAEFRGGQPLRPLSLCPVRQGVVLFLLPDRLMEFNAEQAGSPRVTSLRNAAETRLGKLSSFILARDGGLWIAGSRGLAKLPGPVRNLKPDTEWVEHLPPESLGISSLQELSEDAEGGITALALSVDGQQARIAYFNGQRWAAVSAGNAKIRRVWRGPDRIIWAATADALFQVEADGNELVENQEISARHYFDVALEPGGAFWVATSDGLFRYALLPWQSPAPVRKTSLLVHGFAEDANGWLWFVSGSGLHRIENDQLQEYPLPATVERVTQTANALFPLRDGTLLVYAGETLFRFTPADSQFRLVSPEQKGRLRPLGLLPDGNLCLLISAGTPAAETRLESYDGRQLRPLPWPLPDSMAAARLITLFAARNGELWLSSEEGLARYHQEKWQAFSAAERSNPEGAHSFIELPDGKIWCATAERIWEFDGKNWLIVRSGFDRINALARSGDGSVWVASNSGLHRHRQGDWIEVGTDEGLPSANVREVFEDRAGRVWAGTTLGLSLHHPEADADPPQCFLWERPEGESIVPEGGTIALNFMAQDKWKVTPRHRLLFSHRLDEANWTPFQELSAVSFSDLPPGKHSFLVRAIDRNGNVDSTKPARLDFAVALPWYKETRLVLIALAGLAIALFFAGLAFNRHRRLLRSYAEVERKVAERTQELERASRELLHSQKMNALGTLAAGLAHDFNNILSIVKGSAQIIEDNVDDPGKIRTRTDRIKMVAEQGAGIVRALLGFSRDSASQPAVCDLNAVVDDTIRLLGDRFLRQVEIQFDRSPDLPEVRATRDFIQQILLNFIFNAAESMTQRAGKRVVLATRRLEALPADLVLKPVSAPAHLAVSVQDFGAGIPPENLPRIFEPFFTTKALSTRRGTGLGLSMVYELAKKLEAGLAVESVVNEGTIITLILPVHDLSDTPKSESHAHASSP
jgi:signal transduction histidine kinase/streptogramin lyase